MKLVAPPPTIHHRAHVVIASATHTTVDRGHFIVLLLHLCMIAYRATTTSSAHVIADCDPYRHIVAALPRVVASLAFIVTDISSAALPRVTPSPILNFFSSNFLLIPTFNFSTIMIFALLNRSIIHRKPPYTNMTQLSTRYQ